MAQASSANSRLPNPENSSPMPLVRLEVRVGTGRPTLYEVGDGGFLIGSVPGCDLRLTGPNLPPVICLIARHASGASLRRMAPVLPINVNGRSVASTYLNDGDRVAVGGADLSLAIVPGAGTVAVAPPSAEVAERLRVVEDGERCLKEQREQLVYDQAHWARQREEIAAECNQQAEKMKALAQQVAAQEAALAAGRNDLEMRERECLTGRELLERDRRLFNDHVRQERDQLDEYRNQVNREREETAAVKAQVDQDRDQFVARYQERRDRLEAKQDAVRKVVRKIQLARRKLKADTAALNALRQEFALKHEEIESWGEKVLREKEMLDEHHRVLSERQAEIQKRLADQVADLESRETKLIEERAAFDQSLRQHQTDLVRLDRIQGQLEKRQKNLEQQALEVDRRFEQMQRDSRDLEDQAGKLDAWHQRLVKEQGELEQKAGGHAEAVSQLDQRAAALESQQAMLATLRTRLERMREELREQEQTLSDQRALHEAGAVDLKEKTEEMIRVRAELENDRQLFQAERQRFEERRTMLEGAIGQLRTARESLIAEEAAVAQRRQELATVTTEQTEEAGRLVAQAAQLEAANGRLAADRQAMDEREAAHAKAEQMLANLQDQVRRRSEEIEERARLAAERETNLTADILAAEEAHRAAEEQATRLNRELEQRSADLQVLKENLDRREEALRVEIVRVGELDQAVTGQRQSLLSERAAWEIERQAAAENAGRNRAALETARAEAAALLRQVPELEAKAISALDRLMRSRDQLKEHLAEVHAYARQSREDLESARVQVLAEAERLRQRDQVLLVAQDNHRLAVAAFRQQLIDWRGVAEELRQNLMQDSTRLDRREAEVNEQAQLLENTSARLTWQAEELARQEQTVEEERGQVHRHLSDLRQWYRKKLRDLSGVDVPLQSGTEIPVNEENEAAGKGIGRAILSVTGDIGPGDRQLGDLLRNLDLVDADTLTVLFLEARRQRKTLRQLLLAGSYLTLYQMALIEAGNLDALMLGPVRVVDRLPSSPHETKYRVFDPRGPRDAVLRHLAEAEMLDAVRPDAFRQGFAAAAALRDTHLASTYEVLEIGGRPAVLQEWVQGVPSSEWTALAAAPGVWFRLVAQAATGLRTAHGAGLVHGHLRDESFVITAEGILKLVGLGEPGWLVGSTSEVEPSVASDLAALGAIARCWAAPEAPRKGGKAKPLPRELQSILDRLTTETPAKRYTSAAALLEDLEGKNAVPANATAWERFLQHVREEATATALRQSA